MANNAKNFAAFTGFNEMGWESRRSGYLSEAALVTGIAIREQLGGGDPLRSAGTHLKSHLRSDLKGRRYMVAQAPSRHGRTCRGGGPGRLFWIR